MPYASFSQSLSFSYDNAGNRVKREITMAAKALPKKSDTTYYSEMLSEKYIRIYPNPTKMYLYDYFIQNWTLPPGNKVFR